MYVAFVVLLMFVLPVGSVLIEHLVFAGSLPLLALAGKWFVFWSAGVRLLLAGLRQFFQPEFTADQIFGIKTKDSLPMVRELGIANFSLGIVGVLSLARPDFVLPSPLRRRSSTASPASATSCGKSATPRRRSPWRATFL